MKLSCPTNSPGGVRRHAGPLQGLDERSALVLLHARSTRTLVTLFGLTFPPTLE